LGTGAYTSSKGATFHFASESHYIEKPDGPISKGKSIGGLKSENRLAVGLHSMKLPPGHRRELQNVREMVGLLRTKPFWSNYEFFASPHH
jgi:hypothetical protein